VVWSLSQSTKKNEELSEDEITQRIKIRLREVARQLRELPVAIVSIPCSKSVISGGQDQNAAIGSPPSHADWQQVHDAIERGTESLANPFSGKLDFYLKDLWTATDGTPKSAHLHNLVNRPTSWTIVEASQADDSMEIVKAVCNPVLMDMPSQAAAEVIANKLVEDLATLWGEVIAGKNIPIDTDNSYHVSCNMSIGGGKPEITDVKYGGKVNSKILRIAGEPFAMALVNTMSGADKDHEKNVRDWVNGTARSIPQSQTEGNKTIVFQEDSLNSFPFVGTFKSTSSDDSHRRYLTLVWFDSQNSNKDDIRFCLELSFEPGKLAYSKKISANYRLVKNTAVITPVPDVTATLYESRGFCWSICNSNVTASQLAERFFPLYEQVYRSQLPNNKQKFKAATLEEQLRVKRWIEAVIQDQLYSNAKMEAKADFDPLNPNLYPPVDKAIGWARRINGSDWWGLIQLSIVFCFFYPLCSAALDPWLAWKCPPCTKKRDAFRFSMNRLVDSLKHFTKSVKKESFLQRVRFSTRTMPLLGFLGTVVGISSSLAGAGGVLSEKLIDRQAVLSNMTQNLATAFDTTFIGICGSIALLCVEKCLKGKVED
jgi:hypothetical protein